MCAHHSLALPLSAAYAHDARDGFSFFATTTTAADASTAETPLPPALEGYLDDLTGFLRAARLVQAHPDNYFQFMRGESWAGSAVHFDGSAVEMRELQETQRLLRGFGPLLQGDDAMTKLRSLVRDGPPPCHVLCGSSTTEKEEKEAPLRALNEFYAMTRRLMLGRARRPQNDAATVTLLSPAARDALDRASASALAASAHKQQILDLVVSQGMNPKKQHEVRIMRDTIHDLVESCNAGVNAAQTAQPTTAAGYDTVGGEGGLTEVCASSAVRVETAINIGEGKGYVSRAVALCDNLQVVGLDCNPAHKERAVERVESLLETSLSSRDGRPRVNLLYEPRGHVASIACRVEEDVNWTTLLQGHVLTCPDPCYANTADSTTTTPETGEAEEAYSPGDVEEEEPKQQHPTALTRTRGEESVKLACRVCGKVVRLENTTVIMKHVYTHLHCAKTHTANTAVASLIPSAAQLQTWNLTLSQHAYVAKLTETFFSVTDVVARHHENRKDAALLKRPREGNHHHHTATETEGEGEDTTQEPPATSCLTLQRAPHSSPPSSEAITADGGLKKPQSTSEASFVTLQPTYTARGYRAVLLLAREVVPATAAGASSDADPATEEKASDRTEVDGKEAENATFAAGPSEPPATRTWAYEQQTATVVGYDGGVDCHQVCLDGESKKRVLRLYRLPPPTEGNSSASLQNFSSEVSCVGAWRLPDDPAVWARERVALVLTVLPPALPSTPTVYVPTVRNTVLIGLHPCGDLGSNVCRIFSRSAARGLLLVSCCWHSLTPHGFPLSHALRRRGMTTDSISLLLATQPLDAWSTASPEGHRSSARLLFYRSLFKLLWALLRQEWTEQHQHQQQCGGNADAHASCEFPAPPPHLEPVFLRHMSRQKETLTFVEFMEAVAAAYLYKETAKDTPYTPWNIGHRCAACRDAQEAFVRAALTQRGLPAQMAAAYKTDHFAQFLGLTVLRMWMCHLVESLLLLDRTLYLHEELCTRGSGEDSAVSLVPLFDGALSPRMYGVLARRGGSA